MALSGVIQASAGAASGALTDIGINNDMMKSFAESFKPGCSALFVLVRKVIEVAT